MAQTWNIASSCEVLKDTDNDNTWKIVGSPPRRASMSTPGGMVAAAAATSAMEGNEHSKRRGSFGAFQWESGPAMFSSSSSDVLAVPMVPSVPPEPTYRQHRSLSFSMGQDPTSFGYNDDYEDDRCKSILATTLEEDDDESSLEQQMSRLRMRSRSSGASSTSVGPLTPWSTSLGRFPGYYHHQPPPPPPLQPLGPRHGSEAFQEDYFMNLQQQYPPPPPPPPPMFGPTSAAPSEFCDPLFHHHQRRPSLPFAFPEPFLSEPSLAFRRNSHSSCSASLPADPSMSTPLPSPPSLANNSSSSVYAPPAHLQKVLEEPAMTTAAPGLSSQPSSTGANPSGTERKDHLYMVEFKAGRTDFFYLADEQIQPRVGDLVIVEADRGKDLGKVAMASLSQEQVALLQSQKKQQQSDSATTSSSSPPSNGSKTSTAEDQHRHPLASPSSSTTTTTTATIQLGDLKRIHRLAAPDEINQLLIKGQDEQNALAVCQQKIKQRKLRMDVVDAEYQWDRRKLTFYFVAERRIDFRELVRELFKVYKTRIWMCAVNPTLKNSS